MEMLWTKIFVPCRISFRDFPLYLYFRDIREKEAFTCTFSIKFDVCSCDILLYAQYKCKKSSFYWMILLFLNENVLRFFYWRMMTSNDENHEIYRESTQCMKFILMRFPIEYYLLKLIYFFIYFDYLKNEKNILFLLKCQCLWPRKQKKTN